MTTPKLALKKLVGKFGYHIARTASAETGFHKLTDIKRLLSRRPSPTILDIGANVGQTVLDLRTVLPDAAIHSFEPSPKTFEELRRNVGHLPGVTLNNIALGRATEHRVLHENSSSVMSSFLDTDTDGFGTIVGNTDVQVRTVDEYCAQNDISRLDLLKTDTQGFDLEVLQGASGIMQRRQLFLVLVELTFSRQYKGAAAFDEICGYLREHGFRLVSFYSLKHKGPVADWCDGLFVQESLLGT